MKYRNQQVETNCYVPGLESSNPVEKQQASEKSRKCMQSRKEHSDQETVIHREIQEATKKFERASHAYANNPQMAQKGYAKNNKNIFIGE